MIRGTRGDVDAAVAQLGFNVAQLLLPVTLLASFGVSASFSATRLVPGFATGFLIGSIGLTILAVRASRRREGRATAHAYGSSVPAIMAFTLLIFAPEYARSGDTDAAWQVTAGAVVITGLIKLVATPFAPQIVRVIPAPAIAAVFGAAMYGYLALALLPRLLEQPLVGILTLAIVLATQFAGLRITRWRIPPFVVAWLVPLAVGVASGQLLVEGSHTTWQIPFVPVPSMGAGLNGALVYLPVILPIAIYVVLQNIAANQAARASGDEYRASSVLAWDGLATVVCGLAGCVVVPVVFAVHGAYRESGARVAYTWWTAAALFLVTITGVLPAIGQLFPWSILAALIAFVAIGVGLSALRSTPDRYHGMLLLAFVLPGASVVASAVSAATGALDVSPESAAVASALNRAVHWDSLQAMAGGFLLFVLVVASALVHMIDRRFNAAALWCVTGAVLTWFGVLHSSSLGWAATPEASAGWVLAAAVMFSARWWAAKPADRSPV